jgi:hypothetical protein
MSDYRSTPQSTAQQTSTLAIISLVAGIASWLIVPVIGAIVAIITGNKAKKEIAAGAGSLGGEGLAKAGVILGWANLAVFLLSVCAVVVLILLGPAIGEVFSQMAG